MTIDTKDMLNSILSSISRIDYVRPGNIPNIDLYMDQVTTFMEEQLQSTKRHKDDKILTKTMINNYAKNNLLPPPVKKKYSKEHVLVMILISRRFWHPSQRNISIITRTSILLLSTKRSANWKNPGLRTCKRMLQSPTMLRLAVLPMSLAQNRIICNSLHSSAA